MKTKNQEENWEEKLTRFLLSEEILFENEIGDGWIKISEGKQLTGEYQKIINKVAQLLKSEKEKWLNLTLERIKLKEKTEKAEKLEKIGQAEAKFFIPESSPTQGSAEVHLPLSYRQLSRIQ